jgi:hypothetical protein
LRRLMPEVIPTDLRHPSLLRLLNLLSRKPEHLPPVPSILRGREARTPRVRLATAWVTWARWVAVVVVWAGWAEKAKWEGAWVCPG